MLVRDEPTGMPTQVPGQPAKEKGSLGASQPANLPANLRLSCCQTESTRASDRQFGVCWSRPSIQTLSKSLSWPRNAEENAEQMDPGLETGARCFVGNSAAGPGPTHLPLSLPVKPLCLSCLKPYA